MPDQPQDPELGPFIQLAITNAFVSNFVDSELAKLGMSTVHIQMGLLHLIQVNAPITPTALEEISGLAASTLRDRVGSLVALGYLRRVPSPTDGRSHSILLTEAGEQFMAKVMPIIHGLEARLDDELGGQLGSLNELLLKVRERVAPGGQSSTVQSERVMSERESGFAPANTRPHTDT
jgi:DNA-binding MarR family transcriptional regulator